LASEIRPTWVAPSAPIAREVVAPSVQVDATSRQTIVHQPIVEEHIKRTVVEERQPIIERDVVAPTVIQETKPIYERVVEAPRVYREEIPTRELGVTSFSAQIANTASTILSGQGRRQQWQQQQYLPGQQQVQTFGQQQFLPNQQYQSGQQQFLPQQQQFSGQQQQFLPNQQYQSEQYVPNQQQFLPQQQGFLPGQQETYSQNPFSSQIQSAALNVLSGKGRRTQQPIPGQQFLSGQQQFLPQQQQQFLPQQQQFSGQQQQFLPQQQQQQGILSSAANILTGKASSSTPGGLTGQLGKDSSIGLNRHSNALPTNQTNY